MDFQRLRRSRRTPDGYRLASVEDVENNADMIEQKGIFGQWSALRLLDGWVSRKDSKHPKVEYKPSMDYMLVVKPESSGPDEGPDVLLRKNLYSGITLTVEGRDAALLLSCDDENTEVIYWLLTKTKLGRLKMLINAFQQKFGEALSKAYHKIVDMLLKFAVQPTKHEIDWETALHYARALDNAVDRLTFTELVLNECSHRQRSRNKQRTPPIAKEAVEYLLQEALARRQIKIVSDLLKLGARLRPLPAVQKYVDLEVLLRYAPKFGSDPHALIRLFVDKYDGKVFVKGSHKYGRSVIHLASLFGYTELLKYLIDKDLIPEKNLENVKDKYGQTSLHYAAMGTHDKMEIADELLRESSEMINSVDRKGNTPLHLAAAAGNKAIVEKLLSASESREMYVAKTNFLGQTALHKAAGGGHKEIIGMLTKIRHQIDWDGDGQTPLHFAAQLDNEVIAKEIIKLLLNRCISDEEKYLLLWISAPGIGTAEESAKLDGVRAFLETETKKIKASPKELNLVRMAARMGYTDLTLDLLNRGADLEDIPDPKQLNDNEKYNVENVKKHIEAIPERGRDQPTAIDNLGRTGFAAGLAALFLNPYVKSPVTVGILGDWGMGKSSLMLQTAKILLQMAAEKIVSNENGSSKSESRLVMESRYSRCPCNILTVHYNAWHYRDEHEAWAGLAVEITKKIESSMTTAQWWRTCWRYVYTRKRKSFYLQLVLPCFIAIIIAVVVVVAAWIPLSKSSNKELSSSIKYGSITLTLLGIAWVVVSSAFSVLKSISSYMTGYLRFPDHTRCLGYQQQVIDDIAFLKEELGRKPKMFCPLIAKTWWPWNWFDLCKAISKMTPASENIRIIVFVDDLDRCQEAVILKVLSAINLVLAACEIDVIIGMDKKIIERAIAKEFGDMDGTNNFEENLVENYINKIIQLPLALPDPSYDESKKFLDAQLGRAEKFTPRGTPAQDERIRDLLARPEGLVGIVVAMASSLYHTQRYHYQMTITPSCIYSQIRFNGLTPSGPTARLFLKLERSAYLGQALYSCLHQSLSRGQTRVKVGETRAISGTRGGAGNTRGKRQYYYESQNAKPAPPNSSGPYIGLVAGAGMVFAVGFALFKLMGKVFDFSVSSMPSISINLPFSAGNNKLQQQSHARLNDFARELRSFRSVDMSGRNFGDEGLIFLAESLAYNQTAEDVDFSANGITDVGLKALADILPANDFLKALNLSGNPIGDRGAKDLSAMLKRNQALHKLQLNSVNLGDEGAKALAEMLKKNSSLLVLELNNNMIDYSGFSALAEALIENNTIRAVHLNGNYGGALGAAAFAKGLEVNKSLKEVHLHGNGIGNEGVRTLMSGLVAHRGKITTVDIGNNDIGSKGAFHVAEYIKKSKSLLWLNLYMNDIGDEGAEKIAEALKRNRTLTTVDLGGNNIHAEGASHIAQALKDNSVLTTLELSYNPIGPDGVKALAEVLKFHGNIETLRLGWCQIGVKGAEHIAEALKYNTTISTLDLRANGLGDDGAASLARSLKVVNEVLTSLDLGFNEIRDRGAFALAQALKANEDPAVTSLNLASNFLTKYGQVALTEAKDHVSEMHEGKELNIYF